MEVNLNTLIGILDSGIEPNHYYILQLIQRGISLETENIKPKSWRQGLIRKGYLSDDGKITTAGAELLEGKFSAGKKEAKEQKKVALEKTKTGFEKWWDTFPQSDSFEYKSRKFIGTRGNMKMKKDQCAAMFNDMVMKKEYTESQLITALEMHIKSVMDKSLKVGSSQITYMPNSERYLRDRSFKGYVGMKTTIETPERPKSNAVDI